jgi:hypothetical protein
MQVSISNGISSIVGLKGSGPATAAVMALVGLVNSKANAKAAKMAQTP